MKNIIKCNKLIKNIGYKQFSTIPKHFIIETNDNFYSIDNMDQAMLDKITESITKSTYKKCISLENPTAENITYLIGDQIINAVALSNNINKECNCANCLINIDHERIKMINPDNYNEIASIWRKSKYVSELEAKVNELDNRLDIVFDVVKLLSNEIVLLKKSSNIPIKEDK